MVQTALSEIQTAIYQVLVPGGTLDSTLASLGVKTVADFQGIQEDQPFDYITIGDATEYPSNTFGRRGYLEDITIHIWSRQRGSMPAQLMVAQLNALLDQKTLPLATQTPIYTMYHLSLPMLQQDGLTLHISVKYHIYSQE